MGSEIKRLFKKEFKELDRIVKDLEDVKKRTKKGGFTGNHFYNGRRLL